jgi:hypothetical protein
MLKLWKSRPAAPMMMVLVFAINESFPKCSLSVADRPGFLASLDQCPQLPQEPEEQLPQEDPCE